MRSADIKKAAKSNFPESAFPDMKINYTSRDLRAQQRQSFIEGAIWAAEQMKEENDRLRGIIKELVGLAEDGYKLHVRNACHQEFLEEDRAVLKTAKEALQQEALKTKEQ